MSFSRAPQGARGLKYFRYQIILYGACRAPQGARGLKFVVEDVERRANVVAPRKGRVD